MRAAAKNAANAVRYRKAFTGLGYIPYHALPPAMERYCHDLAEEVRRNAPVDTGELRASVAVEAPGSFNRFSEAVNRTWAVVVNSDHAAAVEYGTIHQQPNPFFRRAIAGSQKKLKSFVHEAMTEAVEDIRKP
jgi:HK97 gp10 family phage protein